MWPNTSQKVVGKSINFDDLNAIGEYDSAKLNSPQLISLTKISHSLSVLHLVLY